ncbi:TPA: hypothetical protein R4X15_003913 [Citrobacter amalonaticus]|nr:hypothetical protein [Citrobacter amalonaticus]
MAYGMMLRDSSGRIFATPDTPCMHFAKKMSFSHTGVAKIHDTGISASLRVVCYTRLNSMVPLHTTQYVSGSTWVIRTRASGNVAGTFYIFTNDIPKSAGGWGMEMYDKTGRRVYSTSARPLQNKFVALNKDSKRKVDVGHATATIAVPQQYWWRSFSPAYILNLEAPCAYGNVIELGNMGAGLTATFPHNTPYLPNGNTVNYINASLYD